MGAHNTVATLSKDVAREWGEAVDALKSDVSYLTLYLGFRGDIVQHGATAANVWVYESNAVGRIWEQPTDDDSPAMFVSFPSLKDPQHQDLQHHTAEVVMLCRWEPFAAWAASTPNNRPEPYEACNQSRSEIG